MEKLNKIFAALIKAKEGVVTKFHKTSFGYSTIDGTWRLHKETMIITRTVWETVFNGYDYDKQRSESIYSVKIVGKQAIMSFVQTKVYK